MVCPRGAGKQRSPGGKGGGGVSLRPKLAKLRGTLIGAVRALGGGKVRVAAAQILWAGAGNSSMVLCGSVREGAGSLLDGHWDVRC